jgi:hypothetical protein
LHRSYTNKIVETVGPGLGVIMEVFEDKGALVYKSCGDRLGAGPLSLPVPGQLLLGQASIIERAAGAVDKEKHLALMFTIYHGLLKHIFSYSGDFAISSESKPTSPGP